MSVFKDYGIILQEKKSETNEYIYEVFFQTYGILWVKRKKNKKEKTLDVGNYFQCEIFTHEKNKNFHSISQIRPLNYINGEIKKYREIELYLRIIRYIKKNIPASHPHQEIFSLLKLLYQEEYSYQHQLLIYAKIIALTGNLPENHETMNIQKLLKFIHTCHTQDIKKLKNFSEDIEKPFESYLFTF